MNNLFSIRVNMLCFSCSRLRLIPVRACESQIQLRVMEIARKRQEAVRDGQPLCLLCFLYLTQSLTELVGTRSRSVTASYTFQFLDDIFYLHSLYQSPDSLKVSVTSSPKEDFSDYTVFYFEFDVAATSSLRLVSQFLHHYSSAGFMLV